MIAPKALLTTLAFFTSGANCIQYFAHRGVFHDVQDRYAAAENSRDALARAWTLGVRAAEIDLRMSSDNQVLVVHDMIANRATREDNYGGNMNPIDVALKISGTPAPVPYNSKPASFWVNKELKVYGRNGKIIRPGTPQRLDTLDLLLGWYKTAAPNSFLLILDIQDPAILKESGRLVKQHGLANRVLLKFFGKKAIQASHTYRGADTCWQYARENNLSDLQIVPQFNDGELTFENNKVYIEVFGHKMYLYDYIHCWADAQRFYQGKGAAQMPMVSISVPSSNNPNFQLAWSAGQEVIGWAKSNQRFSMSILPNPDAGRIVGGKCQYYTWNSNGVPANNFDETARKSKLGFVESSQPDYVIVDVMGDLAKNSWYPSYSSFVENLC